MKYECGNNHAASEAFMRVALVRLKLKWCIINATGSLNIILCIEIPILSWNMVVFLSVSQYIVAKMLKG